MIVFKLKQHRLLQRYQIGLVSLKDSIRVQWFPLKGRRYLTSFLKAIVLTTPTIPTLEPLPFELIVIIFPQNMAHVYVFYQSYLSKIFSKLELRDKTQQHCWATCFILLCFFCFKILALDYPFRILLFNQVVLVSVRRQALPVKNVQY